MATRGHAQVELEPVDMAAHLDGLELYLSQVCRLAGISKMQLDYWTNKAQIPTKGRKQRIYDIDALETVMLISTAGTVIKIPVEDVKRLGRSTQGVIVMRLREGEIVSSLAPVVDSETNGDDEAESVATAPEDVVEPAEEPSDENVAPEDDEPSAE